MPISFLLTEQVAHSGTYNWQAAAVQIAVMQALAALAVWIMLRVLFGPRWLALIPLGVYLFGSAGAAATTWWAVAINQLPHQIALAGVVTAHVLYLRTRHRRWILVGSLFLLLGYGTYTKTVLVPLVLLFLTLAYFASGSFGARLVQTVKRDFLAWLAYGSITLAYTVAYILGGGAGAPLNLGPKTITLVLDHLVLTTPSSLTGGPWDWSVWTLPIVVAVPPTAVLVFSWLAIGGVVTVTALRRRHALVAGVLPLGYLLVSLVFVIQSRSVLTTFNGPDIVSRQMQYLADFVPVAALGLALMLMPLIGAVESSQPRRPVLMRLPWSRTARIAVVTVVLVVAGGLAVGSNIRYASSWRGDWEQRTFFTTAAAQVREHRPVLADTVVPGEAITALFGHYKPIKVIMAPVADHFTVADVGTDLEMFADDGTLERAVVDGDDRMIDPPDKCRRVTRESAWIDIVPTLDYTLWTAVDLRVSSPTDVELAFGPRRVTTTIRPGDDTLIALTDRGYDSLWVRPEAGKSVCIEAVRVGELVPEGER